MVDSQWKYNISAEQVMQEKFPSLYAKSKSGEIVIDMIEQRTDKNGGVIYRVKYMKNSREKGRKLGNNAIRW